MNRRVRWLASVLIGSGWAAVACAESLTYSESIPIQRTGWTTLVAFPQFDPAMGLLEAVRVDLVGLIEGSAAFESLDRTASDIGVRFAAEMTLTDPTSSIELVARPGLDRLASSSAFDGVIDLSGASGRTWAGLAANDTVSRVASAGIDVLSSYVGTGTVAFTVSSAGRSRGSGTGNLLLQFDQRSAAAVSVAYTYSVPEPGTLLLLGAAVVLMRVRRGHGR